MLIGMAGFRTYRAGSRHIEISAVEKAGAGPLHEKEV